MFTPLATGAAGFDLSRVDAPAWNKSRAQAAINSWSLRKLLPPARSYAAGEEIKHSDSASEGVFLVESGLVGLERPNGSSPESSLFALCFPGQIFSQPCQVAGADLHVAIAVTPCTVYSVNSGQLMSALQKGGDDAFFILSQFSENLLRVGTRVTAAATKPAKARFEFLLRELAAVLDNRTLTGSIGLPLKDKDIAGLLGITPGQLSVIKKQMTGARIISYSQQRNELLMKSAAGTLRFCKMNCYQRRAAEIKPATL